VLGAVFGIVAAVSGLTQTRPSLAGIADPPFRGRARRAPHRPPDRLPVAPSVYEWLPEKHLARFVVEVIDGLTLSAMSTSYRGSGSASYHPVILLSLLVDGYATGVFSNRKLERATHDSVAFRFIAATEHPDHDTNYQFPAALSPGDRGVVGPGSAAGTGGRRAEVFPMKPMQTQNARLKL
jgi:hypothetical protein